MSDSNDQKYQGVPIQKLPTLGRPESNRGYRYKSRIEELSLLDLPPTRKRRYKKRTQRRK